MFHRRISFSTCLALAILIQLLPLAAHAIAGELGKPAPAIAPGPLGQEVNPFIGTGGVSYVCGNNHPGAGVPFGMMRLSPDTVSSLGARATNSSGYYYNDSRILGFSHTRLVGTGATDGGNFLVMPFVGDSGKPPWKGLNAPFSHDQERAFPGYYKVVLPAPAITAELTATARVGIHRYTFPKQQAPRILIGVTSALGKGASKAGEVRILPNGEIEGSVQSFGTFSGRYGGLKTHFVARLNQPIRDFTIRSGAKETPGQASAKGDDLGVQLNFAEGDAPQVIELKLAISFVSIANARANLEQEAGKIDFDQALARAVAQWEEKLGRVAITGGTDRERKIFRTALYRSMQMPTLFADVHGNYLGFDGKIHQAAGFDYYTDMSLWDTFRTTHPLYNLIARKEQRDMIVSLLAMAEQGGYLPRWPSGGGYTNSMFGSPADIVIAEAFLKGIRGFDAEAALRYMKKTALGPVPSGSSFSGRVGVEHYLKHEFCPADLMKKSVASTIEYCYADQSIARFAEALNHREDAELFRCHGAYYKNLWNPETQFFQPRNSGRKFSDAFRPELLTYLDIGGKLTHAYVEGSAWQWRWGVPGDGAELIKLFKGREFFVSELERFFADSPAGVGLNPNAFYWHGNQPDIYTPYLFSDADRPDLTQKWVRWVLTTKYGDGANGLDGNDDGGTLSAWYVLSSLGIFPTAGTDRYQLVGPLWKRSEFKIGENKLTIVADNASPDHPYIKKIWLNDQLLERTWIRHAEIAQGGTLRFEMAAESASIR